MEPMIAQLNQIVQEKMKGNVNSLPKLDESSSFQSKVDEKMFDRFMEKIQKRLDYASEDKMQVMNADHIKIDVVNKEGGTLITDPNKSGDSLAISGIKEMSHNFNELKRTREFLSSKEHVSPRELLRMQMQVHDLTFSSMAGGKFFEMAPQVINRIINAQV